MFGFSSPTAISTSEKQNTNSVGESEPMMTFNDSDGVVFTIASSKLEFNKERFPNYTYKHAAALVYKLLVSPGVRLTVKNNKPFVITLSAYKDFPERNFTISKDGIDHNFHIDLWHWWMLETVSEMVRKM